MKINKATFFIVITVCMLLSFVATFGATIGSFHLRGSEDIRFGIDIRGGVEAVFAPKDLERKPSTDELESTRAILETRLDAQNILDREITIDKTNGEVLVRFPWKSNEKTFDPHKAIAELGQTALLTFRDPQGKILVEGKNVKSARASTGQKINSYIVELEFNSAGAEAFSKATEQLVGKQMGIYMDEELISNPVVNQKITGANAQIDGIDSLEEAKGLSDKINSGSLPFSLEAKNYSTISPSLGSGALNVMLKAGFTAFLCICLFMLFYYRLPGFAACFGLSMQIACQLLLLSIPQITLTLPGIAGIILSIGMGVDTNIIIAERIKEEVKNGRSIGAAIESGYKRAFSAVFDGNITTVLVAIVLMIFGSGSMLSFAYTLLSGVLLNFVSGIAASKLMVSSLAHYKLLKKPCLYGGKTNA